jgi:hypothetical protein
MAVCSLIPHGVMVLGRRIEASYITVSYLGELDWNEMKSERSSMISLWNTHGYRTYLFGIELAELQVVRVRVSRDSEGVGVRLLPASGLNLNNRLSSVFEQRALFAFLL